MNNERNTGTQLFYDQYTVEDVLAECNATRSAEGNPTLAELPTCTEDQCGGRGCVIAQALNRQDCGITLAFNYDGPYRAMTDKVALGPASQAFIKHVIVEPSHPFHKQYVVPA